MENKKPLKARKRESPDQEKQRFYEGFAALYKDNLTTQEDFDTAYKEYTDDKETAFFTNSRSFVQKKYFNRPAVKERLGIPKDQETQPEQIPVQGTVANPKKEKFPFAKSQKARYEYVASVGQQTVYARKTSLVRRNHKVIIYRDKKGRFAKAT